MGYTTSGIRNIALVGQAGAGKTSLLETLLLQAGATRSRGSLARGTTVSDFDPQEKRLQHSLDTAICSFDHDGIHINVIDTPGYADFLGKSLSVLEAVEAVAVVVSAASGELLYRFNTGGAIGGGVITYEVGGKQYVAVASGNTSRDTYGSKGSATIFVFGL